MSSGWSGRSPSSPRESAERKRRTSERILALDVGERRIGVAVSDELGIFAQGLPTIERSKDAAAALRALLAVIREYSPAEILVGLPLMLSGREGRQTEKVREFTDQLSERVEIPIVEWDERLSTAQAERLLLEADLSRKKRKRSIDRLAAVLILQSYLDAKRGSVQR